jgi:hypothetical protein
MLTDGLPRTPIGAPRHLGRTQELEQVGSGYNPRSRTSALRQHEASYELPGLQVAMALSAH